MQLESSVFGVCVIQPATARETVEPPEGALTKEIQLTQDLMSLCRLPDSEMILSFDGAA
jgi:hypothetical protein